MKTIKWVGYGAGSLRVCRTKLGAQKLGDGVPKFIEFRFQVGWVPVTMGCLMTTDGDAMRYHEARLVVDGEIVHVIGPRDREAIHPNWPQQGGPNEGRMREAWQASFDARIRDEIGV